MKCMRKIIIILLLGILLLNFNSCVAKDRGYSYNINDALKISAYLFDENCGEDYYIKFENGYDYNRNDDVFELEQLKMNEVRLMAPLQDWQMINLNIFFEFDGIIEVICENKDVQLSFNNPLEPCREIPGFGNKRKYGFEFRLPFECFIAFNPLGSRRGHIMGGNGVDWLDSYEGREYYLNVNAYKFDNEEVAVIKAQLKLVQLEDKRTLPIAGSSCYSIELISYEYSDIYKIMYEIVEEDDDD